MTSKSVDESLDKVFFALSDRNRRKILKVLSKDFSSVGELANILGLSLPGVMKHLGILEKARLITQEKNGRVRSCSFEPKGFESALKYIDGYKRFWEDKFDSIEKLLLEENEK